MSERGFITRTGEEREEERHGELLLSLTSRTTFGCDAAAPHSQTKSSVSQAPVSDDQIRPLHFKVKQKALKGSTLKVK